MTSRRQTLFLLALGVFLGVAIWLFSPGLTGRVESWDTDTPIWLYSWVLVAVLGGVTGRVRGVGLPLGYALGQMLVTIKPALFGDFRMLALGWLFIVHYAAVAIAATLTVAGVTALLKRLWHRRSSKNNDA